MQVHLFNDDDGTTTLMYKFGTSEDYTYLRIERFNHPDYLAVLLFRQKLYDLKEKLIRVVRSVFHDQTFSIELNRLRIKSTLSCSENREPVDVSNLLKLINEDSRFCTGKNGNNLINVLAQAYSVYQYRHTYYGHIPELDTSANYSFRLSLAAIDRLSETIDKDCPANPAGHGEGEA